MGSWIRQAQSTAHYASWTNTYYVVPALRDPRNCRWVDNDNAKTLLEQLGVEAEPLDFQLQLIRVRRTGCYDDSYHFRQKEGEGGNERLRSGTQRWFRFRLAD